ncbi:MAG: flagellar protein FlaG [Lachnospiraceae bacterium]|nr:flagellar protein FlaG [Lachnospiraceae bacterium]
MKIESGAMVNKPVYTETTAASHSEVKPKADRPEVSAKTTESVSEPQVQMQKEQAGDGENTSRRLKNAVEHANQTMRHAKTKCEFSYHEETKRVSIKVIDEETEEIIREIPPEETLEMISKMWELAGLMVDEKR